MSAPGRHTDGAKSSARMPDLSQPWLNLLWRVTGGCRRPGPKMSWDAWLPILPELGLCPKGSCAARQADPPDGSEPVVALRGRSHRRHARRRTGSRKGDAVAQHLVQATQQQPSYHQPADLLRARFGGEVLHGGDRIRAPQRLPLVCRPAGEAARHGLSRVAPQAPPVRRCSLRRATVRYRTIGCQ